MSPGVVNSPSPTRSVPSSPLDRERRALLSCTTPPRATSPAKRETDSQRRKFVCRQHKSVRPAVASDFWRRGSPSPTPTLSRARTPGLPRRCALTQPRVSGFFSHILQVPLRPTPARPHPNLIHDGEPHVGGGGGGFFVLDGRVSFLRVRALESSSSTPEPSGRFVYTVDLVTCVTVTRSPAV